MIPQKSEQLKMDATGKDYFELALVSFFLTVITFGIYSFWARVKRWQFFVGHTSYEGHRFSFHGTGEELFIGFLKAIAIVFPTFLFLGFLAKALGQFGQIIFGTLLYALYFMIWRTAVVSSRRYRMSRMSYRGIRFSFRGKVSEFIKMSLVDSILTLLSLGIYYPWQRVNEMRYFARNTYYGNRPFKFEGNGEDLLGTHLICLVLAPFTLGVSFIWLSAAVHNYQWNHTSFENLQFEANVSGEELLGYTLAYFVVVPLTLGIAYPWILVMSSAYMVESLHVHGELDFSTIEQEFLATKSTGEGIADYLDIDSDLGLT